MKKNKSIPTVLLFLVTIVYFGTIFFTDFSLTGYWTDLIFSMLLLMILFVGVYKNKVSNSVIKGMVGAVIIFYVFLIGVLFYFDKDIFKTRSFYLHKVEGRLFNAYFRPVGAYSGGEGNFWISESPVYFPIIEKEKYYKHAVLWDFRITEWEGQPVDQNEVIKRYIVEEIIEEEKK